MVNHSLVTLSHLVKTDYFLSSWGSGQVIEQVALVATELTREWDSNPTEPQSGPDMI